MKFIQILMSTLMVQAILRTISPKTMTRRTRGLEEVNTESDKVKFIGFQRYPDGSLRAIFQHEDNDEPGSVKCPYGEAGDVLWIREKWAPKYVRGGLEGFKNQYPTVYPFRYQADMPGERAYGGWSPSIHMPKEACRLFLKIKDIRVERLHDITPGDACDEGVEYWNIDMELCEQGELQADFMNYTWTENKESDPNYEDRWFPTFANAVDSFRSLWQSINGPDSWKANPWVWVISFERIEKPENFI